MEWRPVPGLHVDVSDHGDVRNLFGRHVRQRCDDRGMRFVRLRHEGKRRLHSVVRLLCLAWHGPPPTPDHVAACLSRRLTPDAVRWLTRSEASALRVARLLSRDEARQILALRPPHVRKGDAASVAAAYGVSRSLVSAIWRRTLWRRCGTPTRHDMEDARVRMGEPVA